MTRFQFRYPPALPSLILLVLLLSACLPSRASTAKQIQQQEAQSTQAALFVQTEIGRGSLTPTSSPIPPATQTPVPPAATPTPAASATPAPLSARITPLPGLALYTHPEIPDYIFQIDPEGWEKDPSGETADLVHKTIANCQIESVPGHGLAAPQRYFWQDLGQFRWEIMDYGAYAYAVPVLGYVLSGPGGSFLHLQGYNRRTCRNAQEDVLADLLTNSQVDAQVRFVPFPSPTDRPALDGFTCPNTPPARLRIGDYVSVTTDGLWLRSEPRADTSTKIRQFLRYPPYRIRVIGGPVCEKYAYWQVEVGEFGEGGQTIQGWLAEGDSEEYYLLPVK
ncbi:MAG: hypothetical protein EHM21_03455 [Chloroflexi bacterium]|nr:MAG: hypothetical protein EHM21_03455 [Chloroflexota bacterium]